ncbi:MAG: hypothetical protein ABID83_02825 [Candidatus Omnitrophota bacterium]
MKKVLSLFVVMSLFTGFNAAHSQPDMDSATREVDRPVFEKAEEELTTVPKKPKITIEGQVEKLEGLADSEESEDEVRPEKPAKNKCAF